MTTLMTNGTSGYWVSGDVRVLTGEHVGAKPVACPQRERRGAFWGAKGVQTVIADVPSSMSASAFERSP